MTTIENFRSLQDDEWLEMLIMSADKQEVDGLFFPGFPDTELMVQWIGSPVEPALREAYAFYNLLKRSACELKNPIGIDSKVLDFGCGWGRFMRFFWKDVRESGIFGVDTNQVILDVCRDCSVPGTLDLIEPRGPLPYADNTFDAILAYSVFTHLPEEVHRHWISELNRVSKKGCVFALTIEPRRFLDFIGGLAGTEQKHPWHINLQQFSGNIQEHFRAYDAGEFVFLPTKKDMIETYGDAIFPMSFLEHSAGSGFKIHRHIDDPAEFWQAAVVLHHA